MTFRPAKQAWPVDGIDLEQLLFADGDNLPAVPSTSRLPPAKQPRPSTGTSLNPPPDLPVMNNMSPPQRPPRARSAWPTPAGDRKDKMTEIVVLDDDDDEGLRNPEKDMTIVPGARPRSPKYFAPSHEIWEEEKAALARLDQELADIATQIASLEGLRSSLQRERHALASKIQVRPAVAPVVRAAAAMPASGAVNYFQKTFGWTKEIKQLAKDTWGIDAFRLCQEPAINAILDGREVVVLMPTGGGKSLIYQLPALIATGTTVVITPLISLMQDQVYNLTAVNVRAAMLNAATSKEASRSILARMANGGRASVLKGKGKVKVAIRPMEVDGLDQEDDREIKLVFVTPERVDKSKTFISTLQKMYDAGLLARIVVDEAHCTSTLGHDFRQSYLVLGKLKSLFPNTPISALTATASNVVIQDMLKILMMPKKTSPGDAAVDGTTVLFTSPLYRPNLHYSVLPKPKEAAGAIRVMKDYILENHAGQTGIVYCLSRADTENVAKGLGEQSGGKIKCAVYHAWIEDADKLRIHRLWREKKVHCVVATNAFGLGIDSPDVRYVLHHSLSKSLESYYQESGRAGRDGKDSDCVILYRSADASRLSCLIYADFFAGGREKLYEMVKYAENLEMCRKLTFGSYFATTHQSSAAFQEGADANKPCGTCDNCLRDPTTIQSLDISAHAYRALRILSAAQHQAATLTLMQAADLVRGLGGGAFSTGGKKKGKGKVDVQIEAGGKVTLSKDETESLLIQLLLEGYLQEEFHSTAYNTLSYLRVTRNALRLTRIAPEDQLALPITMHMTVPASVKTKRQASADAGRAAKKAKKTRATANRKAVREMSVGAESDEDNFEFEEFEDELAPDAQEVIPVSSDSNDESQGWEVWPKPDHGMSE